MKKIFKIENSFFLHDETINGFGELGNSKVALLTDGVRKSVVIVDDLDDIDFAQDVTNQLNCQPYEGDVTLTTNGGDEAATVNLFNTVVIQCLEMTASGVIPFGVIPKDVDGNIDSTLRALVNANGYWQRAIAFLDFIPDEDGGGQHVVKVNLSGTLFVETIDEVTDVESLNEQYVILPRFNAEALEKSDSILAMAFDLHQK